MKEGKIIDLESKGEYTVMFIGIVSKLTPADCKNIFSPKPDATAAENDKRVSDIELLNTVLKDANPALKTPLSVIDLQSVVLEALEYIDKQGRNNETKLALEKRVQTYDDEFSVDRIKLAAQLKAIDPSYKPKVPAAPKSDEPMSPPPAEPILAAPPPPPEPVPLTTGPSLSAEIATKPSEKGAYNILPLIDLCEEKGDFKKGFNKIEGKGSSESRILHDKYAGPITVRSDGAMTAGSVDLNNDHSTISAKVANGLRGMIDIHLTTKASAPGKHPPLPIDLKVNRNNITTPEQEAMANKIDKMVEKAVAEYLKNSKDPDARKMFTFNGKAIEMAEEKKDVKDAKDAPSLKMSGFGKK